MAEPAGSTLDTTVADSLMDTGTEIVAASTMITAGIATEIATATVTVTTAIKKSQE